MKKKSQLLVASAVALSLTATVGCGNHISYVASKKYDDAKEVQKTIKTPEGAFAWTNSNIIYVSDKKQYGGDYWAPFTQTFKTRKGDCDDTAVSAGALICDDGYKGYLLGLYYGYDGLKGSAKKTFGHMVLVFERDGKLGTIENGKYRRPVYNSLLDLIRGINYGHVFHHKYHNYTKYEYRCKDLFYSSGNVRYKTIKSLDKFIFTDDMVHFIKNNNKPKEVQRYLELLKQRKESDGFDYFSRFIRTFYSAKAGPVDAAITASTLMNDGSYPIRIIRFKHEKKMHAVYLYEKDKLFGSVGMKNEFFREPLYYNINDLVKSLGSKFYSIEQFNRGSLKLPPYPSKKK